MELDQSDRELVERTCLGEREAFEALVERYARVVHVLAVRIAGRGLDPLDLAQETFLRAYAGLGRLRKPERFGPWLLGILRTTGLEMRRADRRTPVRSPDPEGWAAQPSREPLDGGERAKALAEALLRLSDETRLVVTLRLVEGLDSRRIAERLGRPHGTIRSLLSRARRKLRQELEGWEP